jgi:hypothetical protein
MNNMTNDDVIKAFEKWYATEGIRTTVPEGEHWHEFYQYVAFVGGCNWLAKNVLPSYEREMKRQGKEIKKLIRIVNKL